MLNRRGNYHDGNTFIMVLTSTDKENVVKFWAKIGKNADAVGADALGRMLCVYPQTKTYFSHWPDLSYGSGPVKKHGRTVMGGVDFAVKNIDKLVDGMLELSELHAFKIKVDPANFKFLNHCILVVLAATYTKEFTPEIHVSFDKFLSDTALALSDKYR